MNTDKHRWINELTDAVIGAALEVSNVLGAGFLEKVYQRALAIELSDRGIANETEKALDVQYKNSVVGHYYVDLLVENQLIVELKCAEAIANQHIAQTLNYLKACRLKYALILNFQKPRVEIKRVVAD